MTVGKLMVELWKDDEKRLGVKRDQYGVISGMYCKFSKFFNFLK